MGAGVLSQVSFGVETTWGTAVTPNKSIAIHPGDGIQTDNDVQFPQSIKGQLAKNSTSFIGARKHEGDYELDLIPGNAGYFFKSALGAVASVAKSSPNTSVYDHTFTEQASKPSLTIEQAVTDIVRRYAGSIATGFKLNVEAGGSLVADFPFKAKSQASASAITPANETIRPFNFVDLGSTGVSIGGSAFTQVESLELEYRNNIEFKHALGNNDAQFNYPKASEVMGKFVLYLDATSAAKYTDYLAKTDRALVITFTGDTIGTSSNYGLQINIPVATFKTATYPISDDYNKLTIDFEGVYDTATSKLLNVILTNLVTAYT